MLSFPLFLQTPVNFLGISFLDVIHNIFKNAHLYLSHQILQHKAMVRNLQRILSLIPQAEHFQLASASANRLGVTQHVKISKKLKPHLVGAGSVEKKMGYSLNIF